jgi:hypothetical protein
MSKKFTVHESENVIEALAALVKELSESEASMTDIKGRVAAILNARGHEEEDQPAVANALPLKVRRKFQLDRNYDMMTRLELIDLCKQKDIIYTNRKKHSIVGLLREYDERLQQGLCGLTLMSEEDMYRRVLKESLVDLCKHRKVVYPSDAKKDVLVERLLQCEDKTFGTYADYHPRLLINLCRHRGMVYQDKLWKELASDHTEYDKRKVGTEIAATEIVAHKSYAAALIVPESRKHDIVPKLDTQAPKRLKMDR